MVRLLYILLLCLGLGCFGFGFSEKDLVGNWQAVEMIEGKDTFEFDLSKVRLNFLADKKYTYQGNLKNMEAGSYHTVGKMLYTIDTLTQSSEKAVEIIQVTKDSLHLKMNANGRIRNLHMVRLRKSS